MRSICSDHPVRYLRYRARHVRPCQGDAAALRHLIDFLRREGVIPAEKISAPRLTPAERCAQAYEQYLREARALARATIVNYVPFIRDFLEDRFGDGASHALASVCRRCRAICPAPSAAAASEASEAHDQRVALLPALRALSRRGYAGFGRRRSGRGQLVDDVDPPSDCGGSSPSAAGQHRSAHRDGASRLRHLAPARTTGVAFR